MLRPFVMLVSLLLLVGAAASAAIAEDAAGSWSQGHGTRARLVAGTIPGEPGKLLAGIEIELAPGWKTYWRNPGESGGVPPRFDWSGSQNVADARVLYPAPHRLPDAMGDSIGYKQAVTLPVLVKSRDPGAPASLDVKLEYGVCREICVPVEAALTLQLPPSPGPAPEPLLAAFTAVPRTGATVLAADPRLEKAAAALAGKSPHIDFEVSVPGGAGDADLFVEAPEGIYLPLPHRTAASGNVAHFTLDLSEAPEAAQLPGKRLTLTMTSSHGASETTWMVK